MTRYARWKEERTPDSEECALTLLRAGREGSGVAGERFAAFTHLVRGDTRARSIALLGDPSPVVRAYAGECLACEHPEEVERLLPLLVDTSELIIADDYRGGRQFRPLGSYVLGALRLVRHRSDAHAAAFERVIAGLARRPLPID